MNQKGIVSLVAVAFITIFVLVITTSMSMLMVGEQRQATDNSNTIASYYASYSGIEETYALVSAANQANIPLYGPGSIQQDCNANPSIQTFFQDRSGAPADAGHTCRIIQTVANDDTSTLHSDKVQQYNLTFSSAYASKSVGSLDFSWDDISDPTKPSVNVAPVVFTVLLYRKNKTSTPLLRSVILQPSSSSSLIGGESSSSVNFSGRDSIGATAIIKNVACTGSYPTRCHVSINNINPSPASDWQTVVRIRPTNHGDITYKLKAFDEGGVQLKIALPDVHADVTSRDGDSFNRLTSEIPVYSKPLSVLDNVIFGNNSICKDFILLTDAAGYSKVQVGPPSNSGEPGCRIEIGSDAGSTP